METVVEVRDLRKRYGDRPAVDGVSLSIRRGEVFGILGPNGAGKTTTVECLTGLRAADGGEVRVLGVDPQRDGTGLRQRIGVQLQSAALPDRMRVGEALGLFASFYRRTVDPASLLREWGLEDKRSAAFAELSGGQQQRLFIALALLNDPEVVVFDELTTGLDPQVRRATWELLGRIRERGTTVVLVTHSMEEAERLCDRVAIIDRGRVVALDRPAALVAQRSGLQRIRCTVPDGLDVSWLHAVAGVSEVHLDGDQLSVSGDGPLMARVSGALAEHGIAPPDLRAERASLDDVFLALTGHEIR